MTINVHRTRALLLVTALAVTSPALAQRTATQLVAGAMDNAQPAKGSQPGTGAQPAPAPGAPGDATPQAKKPDLPTPPPNFEYAPQGRRDPFLSLVDRGEDKKGDAANPSAKRAEGVPGMMTAELVVRGIMQTRGSWVAMVSGAAGKVYTVRAGDKLADGVVRSINQSSVVILQEVNDPLSLEKQREVRKLLRGGEEVK